jgi:hypothetical protein
MGVSVLLCKKNAGSFGDGSVTEPLFSVRSIEAMVGLIAGSS